MNRLLLGLAACAALTASGQNKPYITRVYDYMPAPGQFVNLSPACSAGEPRDSVIARAERALCGATIVEEGELPDGTLVRDTTIVVKPGMISLGSFGGYVVFGFDHPVVNVDGERDFQVFGNAFKALQGTSNGGSSEPGIVMVSRDDNGNGLPDDEWYELAGSEYNNPRTQHHFSITYYKPGDDKPAVPDPANPTISDTQYIAWTCNSVDSLQQGYVMRNTFHVQSYWPLWVESDELTFTGTKLPCNASDESAAHDGSYWVQRFYEWGYVDNRPDYGYGYDATEAEEHNLGFDIGWAVDDNGGTVRLEKVDFIKVYSAVLQQCGWIGETSTEVCGAIDLHPDALPVAIGGDIDGNGKVEIDDVNVMLNVIMHINTDPETYGRADLNGDNTVDVDDVNALINIVLHK